MAACEVSASSTPSQSAAWITSELAADQALRDRHLRRVVLVHGILSYVFGVVIIAAAINLTAGPIQ